RRVLFRSLAPNENRTGNTPLADKGCPPILLVQCRLNSLSGVKAVIELISQMIKCQHCKCDGHSWNGGQIPRRAELLAATADHGPPASYVRVAEPEKGQTGFHKSGMCNQDGTSHDDGV